MAYSNLNDDSNDLLTDGGSTWAEDMGRPANYPADNYLAGIEAGDELGAIVLQADGPARITITVTDVVRNPSESAIYGVESTREHTADYEVRLWTSKTVEQEDGRVANIVRSGQQDPEWPPERQLDEYALPVISLARSPRDDLTDDLQTWLITQGASWTQAGDYIKTTRAVGGQYTIEEWSEVRGTSHQAVSDARSKAKRAMADALPEEVPAVPGGLDEPSVDDLE